MKLGLFTRDQSTSVSASYALIADRSLALDLDDESGRIEKASALKFQAQEIDSGLAARQPCEETRAHLPYCWRTTAIPSTCRFESRGVPGRSPKIPRYPPRSLDARSKCSSRRPSPCVSEP